MCPDAITLSAYFDGELDIESSSAIRSHVASCGACQASLDVFARQRSLIQSANPPAVENDCDIADFWDYVGRSRVTRHAGPRRLSIPVPIAAAAVLAFTVATVLNFVPGRNKVPDVVVFEAAPQAPTVVSLTVTPGELDEFIALLEGGHPTSSDGMPVLPDELPVVRLGDPQMVRSASFERAP